MTDSFFDFEKYDIAEAEEGVHFQSKGDDQSVLLVIIKSIDYSPKLEELLGKILKSIGFDISTAHIVQMAPEARIALSDLDSYQYHTHIIGLGISSKDISINPDKPSMYKVLSLADKKYLFGPSLPTLDNSLEDKKRLWAVLKSDFNPKTV